MRNTYNALVNFFSPEQVYFKDLSFKMSEAESHYSFASFNHEYARTLGLPFNIHMGFVFNPNGVQVPVAFFEVKDGLAIENGTKLVKFNSSQDVMDFFCTDVQPAFPADQFDALVDEALKIYDACFVDFNTVNGDFFDIVVAKKPFYESYYTESKSDSDYYTAHILFTCGEIAEFLAQGRIEKGVTAPIDFIAAKVNNLNKLDNAPVVGELVSSELNAKLNQMFYDNKYLGIRQID